MARRLPRPSGWLASPGPAQQVLVQGSAFGFTRAALLLASVLTARVSGVDAYGAIAIGLVVYQAGVLLRDAGFGQSLVILGQRGGLAWAAFGIVTLVGAGLGSAMWITARIVSTLVGVPAATEAIQLLSIAFAVGSVGVVPNAMLEGRLRFGARAAIDILAYGALLTTTLALLWVGFGAAALPVGYIVQSLAQSVAALVLAQPWRDRGAPFGAVVQLAKYSSLLWASSAFAYLSANVDKLVVARLGGAAAVGTYSLCYSVATLITIAPSQVVNRVALAHYALGATDRRATERTGQGALRLSVGLSALLAVFIALAAPEVAELIVGSVTPAAALVVLAAHGLARSTGICFGTALNGVGLARHGVVGAGLNVVLMAALVPLGYETGGLLAAAAAVLVAMLASVVYMARRAIPVVGLRGGEVWLYVGIALALALVGALLVETPSTLRIPLLVATWIVWILGLLRVEGRGVVSAVWSRASRARRTGQELDARR